MTATNKRASWEWNKDAEFWFDDSYGEISGALNHSRRPYTVGFDMTGGTRSEVRLFVVMQTIQAELPEYELRMPLSKSSDTRQLLDELAAMGLIQWEEVAYPSWREARITSLKPPVPKPPFECRKPWWRFW